jgi:hypothetical protein
VAVGVALTAAGRAAAALRSICALLLLLLRGHETEVPTYQLVLVCRLCARPAGRAQRRPRPLATGLDIFPMGWGSEVLIQLYARFA